MQQLHGSLLHSDEAAADQLLQNLHTCAAALLSRWAIRSCIKAVDAGQHLLHTTRAQPQRAGPAVSEVHGTLVCGERGGSWKLPILTTSSIM